MKKILVLFPHVIIKKKDGFYYKSPHAYFLNKLSERQKVTLLCGYKEQNISKKEWNEAGMRLFNSVSICKTEVLEGGWNVNLIFSFKKVIKLVSAILNHDIIHISAPSYGFLIVSPIIWLLRKKQTVFLAAYWEDEINLFYNKTGYFSRKAFFISKWLSEKVSEKVFVMNSEMQERTKGDTEITRPLVVNDSFIPLEYQEFNINKEHNFVFLGELVPRKNVEFILKAINRLKEKYKIHLNVIGSSNDEKYKSFLKKLSKDLDIVSKITWHGWIGESEKLRQMLKKQYAMILPSKSEGFPQVIFEVQSLFLPILISNLSYYKTSLKHKENALLFKLESVEGLVQCMRDIMDDKELYQKVAISGWEYTKEQLSVTAAEQYCEIIK